MHRTDTHCCGSPIFYSFILFFHPELYRTPTIENHHSRTPPDVFFMTAGAVAVAISTSVAAYARCPRIPIHDDAPKPSAWGITTAAAAATGITHTERRRRARRSAKRMMSVNAAAAAAAAETAEILRKGIAEFYDESSRLWEDIWGDHMHHGFYDADANADLADHHAAQIRMIEESLRFASLSDDPGRKPSNIVDVGCGIGGSSRYLARKFGARCQGITLSPVQAQRAQQLADAQGLDGQVSFQVADALNQPFPDGHFDLVWSMESGEHMPDKEKFVNELVRVASPGGTIIIVTWCHRDLSPSEESLRPEEKDLLDRICNAYYLPGWCSIADYVKMIQSLSLEDIKSDDWSQNVAPFWPAVIKSALTWKGIISLFRSGWKTIRGALVMPLMIQGYRKGLIKFAIITCRKPASSS